MHGGIPIVEITMTVPGALELMAHLIHSDPKVIVGAGSVLDTKTARLCIEAGASFITSPSFNPESWNLQRKKVSQSFRAH